MKRNFIWIGILLSLLCSCAFAEDDPIVYYDGLQNTYGYLTSDLEPLFDPQFRFATEFNEGVAIVQSGDEQFSIIDTSGQTIAVVESDEVYASQDGRIRFRRNGKWGFFDQEGNVVIDSLDLARDFSEGKAFARVGGQSTYIDKNGIALFSLPDVVGGGEFNRGHARVWVETDGPGYLYGLIDTAGEYVFDPQFSRLGQFSDGLAAAGFGFRSRNTSAPAKYGYVDRHGRTVIDPVFFGAKPFENGFALVRYRPEGGMGAPPTDYKVIDKQGNTVATLESSLQVYSGFRNGYSLVGSYTNQQGALGYGFIDTEAHFVTNTVFVGTVHFSNGVWSGVVEDSGSRRIALFDSRQGTLHFLY